MSNTPKFEWNESLVRELVGIAHKDGYTSIQETDLDKMVEQFKQSKALKQDGVVEEMQSFDLNTGVLVDDKIIRRWHNETLNDIRNGKPTSKISSGRAMVIATKVHYSHEENPSIEVIEITNGYKRYEYKNAKIKALNEDTVVGDIQELLAEVLQYFDKDTTNVPQGLYKEVFNFLYPPKTDTVVEDNHDTMVVKKDYWKQVHDDLRFLEATLDANQDKVYTKDEVDYIRKEAWFAAREEDVSNTRWQGMMHTNNGLKCVYYPKYPTINDYLNSFNPDNKAYTGKVFKANEDGTFQAPAYFADMPFCKKSDTGKDSKEWEVTEIRHREMDGKDWILTTPEKIKNALDADLGHDWYIYSVRSNGQIFSVGETVLWGDKPLVINGFKIDKGNNSVKSGIMFYNKKGNDFNIFFATKQPQPTPEKTVTDNSDVACLSANDIKWWLEKYFDYPNGISVNQLTELVNQKLKTHTP